MKNVLAVLGVFGIVLILYILSAAVHQGRFSGDAYQDFLILLIMGLLGVVLLLVFLMAHVIKYLIQFFTKEPWTMTNYKYILWIWVFVSMIAIARTILIIA